MPPVAVMRPKLPTAARIAPYLEKIDSARIYSNFGPLNTALEDRLAAHFGLDALSVTTQSNATMSLTLALEALGAKRGTLCAMPAWTFIASAHAAAAAGLIPYFIDVDRKTWALDPESTLQAIGRAPGEVTAVMPVSPFGCPVDSAAWDRFAERTGLAVVIDAAAGFDTVRPAKTPTVVSLHATKVLGIGEGGFVVSTDKALVAEVRTRSNFGFPGTRKAQMLATNGKLSEYQAAVGLAAMDEWPEARAQWMAAAKGYREAFDSSSLFQLQPGFGDSWVGSACLVRTAEPGIERVERIMAEAGIEVRRWWGEGAHRHPATDGLPTDNLSVTEDLVRSSLAVPFYRDLSSDIVQKVAIALRHAQSCTAD